MRVFFSRYIVFEYLKKKKINRPIERMRNDCSVLEISSINKNVGKRNQNNECEIILIGSY